MRDSRLQLKLAADTRTRRPHYSCSWKVDCKIGHTFQLSSGLLAVVYAAGGEAIEHSQPNLSAVVIRPTGGLPKHGLSDQEDQPGEERRENVPFRGITQEGTNVDLTSTSNPTCPPSDAPPHHLPGSVAPGDPIVSPTD